MKSDRIHNLDDRTDNKFDFEHSSKRSARAIVIIFVIVCVVGISIGVYFLLQKKKRLAGKSQLDNYITNSNSKAHKKQLPTDSNILDLNSPVLSKAIKLYKTGYIKTAKANFVDILESTENANVKSMAATYLGIIYDDEGKFVIAHTYFDRAVKLNEDNYIALYNKAVTLMNQGNVNKALDLLNQIEKSNPKYKDLYLLKGKIQYDNNNLKSAKIALEKALDLDHDPLAYYNLGKILKKQGLLTEAKDTFLNALQYGKGSNLYYQTANELGLLYATQNRPDLEKAKQYFELAVKHDIENPKYHYNLALIEYKLNNKEATIEHLNMAVKYGYNHVQTYQYIAKLYEELKEHARAEEVLREGLDKDFDNTLLLTALADNLTQQGKWEESILILEKIVQYSTKTLEKANALYNLGKVHLELQDFDRAKNFLEASIDLDPTNADTFIAIGNLYITQGKSHKAIAIYTQALENNPDSINLIKELSRIYIDKGLTREAEYSLQKIMNHPLKTNKDVTFGLYHLGTLFHKQENYEKAIHYFNKAKELAQQVDKEQYFSILMYLSEAKLNQDMAPDLIYPHLKEAIRLKPQHLEARLLLAKAYMQEGFLDSFELANQELSIVLDSDSTDPTLLSKAYTAQGIIFYKQELFTRALNNFNKALELDPSNTQAFQNKRSTSLKIE